jgi:hypothetical protein
VPDLVEGAAFVPSADVDLRIRRVSDPIEGRCPQGPVEAVVLDPQRSLERGVAIGQRHAEIAIVADQPDIAAERRSAWRHDPQGATAAAVSSRTAITPRC